MDIVVQSVIDHINNRILNKVQFLCFFNPFAPVIVFFVDFCVCPTIVPYPANAS